MDQFTGTNTAQATPVLLQHQKQTASDSKSKRTIWNSIGRTRRKTSHKKEAERDLM
jgi:hypothetical protein